MACSRDSFNRPIDYLRISVTDRCNFRCAYCMPPDGVNPCDHNDILTYEEIVKVARAAAELGISKIRLTGGEPLVRLGLVDLARMLAAIPGIDDLTLTTNGALLARYALDLKAAGVKRVNISLDTMRPDRFQQLTGTNRLTEVLAGIAAAEQVGFNPIKINTVLMRGLNDDELLEMASKTLECAWNVRFIELMPMGQTIDWQERFISTEEMRQRLTALGPLKAVYGDSNDHPASAGPARYYRLPGARGTIGFISAISEHFCAQCNRLRLTADGRLRPCLMSDKEIDLRAVLRQDATMDEVKEVIATAIRIKPRQHHLAEGVAPLGRAMSEIGG